MQSEKYTVSQLTISAILGFIEAGAIAIPEIQRPFVWSRSQVRDLIDSLYNGYPTGYLIIWQNPNVRTKGGDTASGKKILIDGQQRVTALMAAISGCQVIDDEYNTARIKIAFNPLAGEDEERFAVQTPAHVNDKKWIPDIAEIFKSEFDIFGFVQDYCLIHNEISTKDLSTIVTKLRTIASRQIGVIELVHSLEIDEVTEIFIRINSQGKALSQADFAMSKIAADEKNDGHILRKAVDYFSHLAVKPEFYPTIAERDPEFMASEYAPKLKWLKDDKEAIYDPDYGDMLRVCFMHQFGRGKLSDLVSLLSGRDFNTREFKEEISEESFSKLKTGVLNFMNEFNFTNFVLAIKSAGFISERLINSQMTLNFAYTLYLILAADKSIPKTQLKRYVQKWYVLSVLTGRYISSPETAMHRDIQSIVNKGFPVFFDETESAVLSDTFWKIGLVQNLETSAINSPYFITFLAAQSFLGDSSLFMNGTKVSDLISMIGDVHHIFPKNYLKKYGIDKRSRYNQVANYIFLDTQLNISIGDKAPSEYFKDIFDQCTTKCIKHGNIQDIDELQVNLKTNCIPSDIISMDYTNYDDFLLRRRQMMAEKIEKYYKSL